MLRGVAVLLVLVHHSPGGEGVLLKAGWTGVDLFFVLSGFLVSGSSSGSTCGRGASAPAAST